MTRELHPLAEDKQPARRRMPSLEAIASAVAPAGVLFQARRTRARLAAGEARRAFSAAGVEPEFLPPDMLASLHEQFPYPMDYAYDAASLAARGRARFRRIQRLVPRTTRRGATLEVGCGDGMLSCELRRDGARAVALDIDTRRFDERARLAGVDFVEGDASALPFEAGGLDLVVSFNSFEHFEDPSAVLHEMIRVTRPGGRVYMNFGPLYGSAFGLHAGRSVNVPFCHYLFERSALEAFTAQRGSYPIPFQTLNGWRVRQFRALWAQVRTRVRPILHREIPYVAGLDLVRRYPSVFRSKTDDFNDLLIGEIEVLFERVSAPRHFSH